MREMLIQMKRCLLAECDETLSDRETPHRNRLLKSAQIIDHHLTKMINLLGPTCSVKTTLPIRCCECYRLFSEGGTEDAKLRGWDGFSWLKSEILGTCPECRENDRH